MAVLYDLCLKEFASDTLILHDGLLRTKIFSGDLFVQMYHLIHSAIEKTRRERRRDLFIVGIAKHSEVLERYALAMAISEVFPDGAAQYAPISMEMQTKVYKWAEYLRLPTDTERDVEQPKFNMGEMYFVRFGPDQATQSDGRSPARSIGPRAEDLWFTAQRRSTWISCSYYPQCLQQADAHAQIVDLDLAILQDTMVEAVRATFTATKQPLFDAHRLALIDPAARRYT